MLKVGLTGGYASGKSLVAAELARLGCHVIYADELGHSVSEPGGEAYPKIVEAFGPEILSKDGMVDRKKLAAIVFESPELLEKLTGLVHPAVFRLEKRMFAEFEARDPQGIVVLEAAILIETGRDAAFDQIILTACDRETQIARGMKRDHLTREQVLARLDAQMPLEEKQKRAHYIVDTSGSKQETMLQVAQIYRELKEIARTPSQ